jgi:hypothetical protein
MTSDAPRLPGFEEPELTVVAPTAPLAVTDTFTVEVVRSARRTRTVGAQMNGDVLTITIPSWMSGHDERHWVSVMSGRFRRALSTERINLAQRAAHLARRYRLSTPAHIVWVDNMVARWGSCTPATRSVRVSSRLAAFPDWVVDYVIVHELAHIDVGDHSPAFWELVHRYPLAERAIGYLIAKSGDADGN